MKLSDLRTWLFELIALVVPGAFALCLVFACFFDAHIGFRELTGQLHAVFCPFKENWLNVGLFFSITFTTGHLVQHLSVYALKYYAHYRKAPYRNCIDDIFSLASVREFLLPPETGLDIKAMPLSNNDVFMMTYPDTAPKTKRDTFIAISGFCGAMGVVSLLSIVPGLARAIRLAPFGNGRSLVASGITVAVSLGIAIMWFDRCSFFHDLADRVVVNYFLGTVGAEFRARQNAPSTYSKSSSDAQAEQSHADSENSDEAKINAESD